MRVEFYKLDGGRLCGWAATPPKRRTFQGTTMASGRDLPNDLGQFVVEAALGFDEGFWGLLANGASIESVPGRRATRPGRALARVCMILAIVSLGAACSNTSLPSAGDANAGIDSLNARLVSSYRARDPQAYGALYTDSAVFEWPAFTSVHGPTALAAMARDNWAGERDVDLRLKVSSRKLAPDHATEFGAFEQDWTDSSGVRRTEFGRYVSYLLRQTDGSWHMDRFFGFEDSTRVAARRQP